MILNIPVCMCKDILVIILMFAYFHADTGSTTPTTTSSTTVERKSLSVFAQTRAFTPCLKKHPTFDLL